MQSNQAISSNIEGNKVIVKAGQDINFTAVNAISDRGTQLSAGGDVNILAAENTSSESSFSQTKKIRTVQDWWRSRLYYRQTAN